MSHNPWSKTNGGMPRKLPNKRCPVKDCTRGIKPDLVMCGVHWGMVPTERRLEYLTVKESDRRRAATIAGQLVLLVNEKEKQLSRSAFSEAAFSE